MWESITVGDLLGAVTVLAAAWRAFTKIEQSLAVNDARNEVLHSFTTDAIKGLTERVKEQNGRVTKVETSVAEMKGEMEARR